MLIDRDEVSMLVDYYSRQAQQGGGMSYFYLPHVSQRGSGVGSWLAGAARGLIPLLRKGSAFLAPYLAKTAANVMNDYASNPSNDTFRSSLKSHGIDSLDNLSSDAISKMRGGRLGMMKRRRKTAATTTTAKKKSSTSIKRKAKPKKTSVRRKTSKTSSAKKKSTPVEYPFFR